MSPIENIWAWLDHKVKKAQCSTIKELKDVVEEALKSPAGREQCVNMCRNFKKRLRTVIELKGENVQNTNPRKATANSERIAP